MNIGAIKLSKNQNNYYLQYFMALGTQWQYMPSERELNVLKIFLINIMEKNMSKFLMMLLKKIKIGLSSNQIFNILSLKITL